MYGNHVMLPHVRRWHHGCSGQGRSLLLHCNWFVPPEASQC
jgi:hypothetical protein